MGILYIVPTPVGNMEDMTFRAVRILKEVDLILAEDTRTSGILLKHYEIKNSLLSHHKFNEHGTSASVVSRLLAGENVALISDAGTPGHQRSGLLPGSRGCQGWGRGAVPAWGNGIRAGTRVQRLAL